MGSPQGATVSPLLANVYLHYVFDLWADHWRKHQANGEVVIIAADRTPVGQTLRVEKVDFLGEPALFPQGPFILASLLKCPVYTVFCLKRQSKHVIHFDYFSGVLKFPRKNREQAMQQTIQLYAERLQHYCLKEPLQWFNFFDFWHIDNDGE